MARSMRVGVAVVLLVSLFLPACQFRDRNSEVSYLKSPEPSGLSVFVDDLPKIATSTFAADYTITGSPYTNGASLSVAPPRGRLDTSAAGVQVQLYFTLDPASATACASTGGVSAGCHPVGGSDADATTMLLSPHVHDELVGLFLVPGARISEATYVGQPGLCLNAPATAISPDIRLCVAKAGGVLFYSNGTVTIEATSYTPSVAPAALVAPAASAAGGLGI